MTNESKKFGQKFKEGIKQYADVGMTLLMVGALVVFYHAIVGNLLHVAQLDIFKSMLMQIFGVVLPGFSLYLLLYKRKQSMIGAIAISYALGYVFNIISYFLLVPIGAQAFVPYFVIIIAVVSLFIIVKKGKQFECVEVTRKDIPFIILFFVFLFLNILAYSSANVSPSVTDSAWYPTDIMFWIENTAALAREFPTTEPRVHVDYTLYYHYFSSVQLAFTNLATGIDCYTLSVPLFTLGKCIIFFGSFYVLFKGLTKNIWLQLFGIIAICFSSGFDGLALPTYTSHVWTHPFGFDIGLAFGALFLHCFFLQWNEEKFDVRVLIITALTFAGCVGLKAPLAVIALVPAGIVCISWLPDKKFVNAFSYGISLLAVFAIIAVGCVGMLGVSGESSTGGFSLWAVLKDYSFFSKVYPLFGASWPSGFKAFVLSIAYCVVTNPLIIGLFGIGIVSMIADRRMLTARNVGLSVAGLLGLGLGLFNDQPGYSQMYFSLSAILPCIILGVVWLNHKLSSWDKPGRNQAAIWCGCFLTIQVCFMFFQGYTYWGQGLNSALNLGYKNMFQQEAAKQAVRQDGIQKDDLEALSWIRDNTAKDSVVLSDRSVVGEMPKYMFYGAFCERQMYLEGDIYYRERYTQERENMRSLTKQVYQNSKEALQETIQDGVDYIVQTKWLTPNFAPDGSLTKLVHSSETINVYEVIK